MANHSNISTIPQQFSLSFDTTMALETTAFPFRCVPTLEPLITYWQQWAALDHPGRGALARGMQEALAQAPELLAPIEDLSVIAKHKGLVDLLMSVVFPPVFWERDYGAASLPYQLQSFYATPPFASLLMAPDGTFGHHMQVDQSTLAGVGILSGYVDILRKVYGITLDFEFPLILTTSVPATGLERSFRMRFSKRFLDIQHRGGPTTLSITAHKHLLAHLTDLRVWMDILPPEHFVFQGFTIVNAVDVTEQAVLSSLKREGVDNGSRVAETTALDLQDTLRTLLRRPEVVLMLVAIQDQQVFVLNCACPGEQRCQGYASERSGVCAHATPYHMDDLAGSLLAQAITQGQLLVIDDLAALPRRAPLDETFLQHGMRNLLVMPLYDQHDLLGVLALGSPQPGDLHALTIMQLREALPLLSMAVKRGLEARNHRVQAFIKEQYTAIHPAVEWRFRQVALHMLQQQSFGAEPEPIVFNDVYPLYALSDIRGASITRHEAIQADLLEHLRLAEAIVRQTYTCRPLPALDELMYRIRNYAEQIGANLNTGDEEAVLDFLHRHVEPFFDHLQSFDPSVRACVQAYRAAMDPRLGIVYHRRRDFEASVTRINETIAAYLHAEEAAAQQMFPHYFEAHTSDGVEHEIYVGATLVEDGKFDPLYLHNLRLWQLLVLCGAALLTAQLREALPIPLETTHLVLAHDTPLSIRFHPQEKQFEVDGAYNMRYQIIKNRIDKALIKGTTERLTQPGTIAIVYSQPREAEEYRHYLAYLCAKGYVTSEIEDVDLEDLQGAHGLKALRVTVNMQAPLPRQPAPYQGPERVGG